MVGKIKKIMYGLIIGLIVLFMNMTYAYAITPSSNALYEGIDVSNWQGYIDYSQVKAQGIEIVYMKTSQGTTYKDPYFDINYQNAKANGLKVGFYHFLTATTTQGAAQEAQFFASVISGKVPDCKLVMDYESFSGASVSQINQVAQVFMENVK